MNTKFQYTQKDLFRAIAIFSDTLDNGGGTYTKFLDAGPKTGFAVGGEDPGRIVSGDQDIVLAILKFSAQLPMGRFLGTWLHDGEFYLDSVSILEDKDEAIALGRKRGEIAIFNLGTGGEIPV
jgi:hypothetical protein